MCQKLTQRGGELRSQGFLGEEHKTSRIAIVRSAVVRSAVSELALTVVTPTANGLG
ncbi:MAG: hypothetical protein RLY23_1669 [Actinomycetota bacterium]|jgi:hypothetical protein